MSPRPCPSHNSVYHCSTLIMGCVKFCSRLYILGVCSGIFCTFLFDEQLTRNNIVNWNRTSIWRIGDCVKLKNLTSLRLTHCVFGAPKVNNVLHNIKRWFLANFANLREKICLTKITVKLNCKRRTLFYLASLDLLWFCM